MRAGAEVEAGVAGGGDDADVPGGGRCDEPVGIDRRPQVVPHAPRKRRRGQPWRYPWPALLRRVFGTEVLVCARSGGRRKVLAAIHDPESNRKVLEALGLSSEVPRFWPARSPPRRANWSSAGRRRAKGTPTRARRWGAQGAAFLCGEVLDGRGAAAGCAVNLSYQRRPTDTGGGSRDFALPGKPFRIGPLHEGIYQLRIKVRDCAAILVEDLVVEAGRDFDLGRLTAEPSGTVTATIVSVDGEPRAIDRVWLARGGRCYEKLATGPAAPVAFEDVAAGDYLLTVWSDELGMAMQRVAVPAGGQCQITLQLASGVPCTFDLRVPSLVFGVADLRWLDSAGNLIGKEQFQQTSETTGSLRRRLPIGSYRLEFRGWMKPVVGAADFVVTDPMPAPILLEVREVSRDEWGRWPR